MPRRAAFSLIEVTIVILVIGLMAAVGAPRFAGALRSMQLRAAAKQLASHVDYIRNVAMNQGRPTTLICDNTANSYRSNEVDFPERVGELISVSLTESFDPSINMTADFDGKTTLTFDHEGMPRVGNAPLVNGQIVLTSGSDSLVIQIVTGSRRTATVIPVGDAITL